jgi:DNA invertase Pin-like site-specific DNA recombinase
MTGPRPAGRPWTPADDDQLRAMLKAGTKVNAIAKKLKRTVGAIYSRSNKIRKICDQLKS